MRNRYINIILNMRLIRYRTFVNYLQYITLLIEHVMYYGASLNERHFSIGKISMYMHRLLCARSARKLFRRITVSRGYKLYVVR